MKTFKKTGKVKEENKKNYNPDKKDAFQYQVGDWVLGGNQANPIWHRAENYTVILWPLQSDKG